jgi:hypothetical protein
LVWIIANHIRQEKLDVYKENRPGNVKAIMTLDILDIGEKKLKSSTLTTFNRKVRAMAEGRRYDEEQDSLPQFALSTTFEDPENTDSEKADDL